MNRVFRIDIDSKLRKRSFKCDFYANDDELAQIRAEYINRFGEGRNIYFHKIELKKFKLK